MVTFETFDVLDKHLKAESGQIQSLDDEKRWDMLKIEFHLDSLYWNKYYSEISKHTFNWNEIKYAEHNNMDSKITTDDIGIYLFVVKPDNMVLNMPQYVLYVGISGENDSGRPLKDRINDYFNLGKIKKRNKLHRALKRFYNNVYIYFSTVSINSDELEKLEKDMHGFFIPPTGDRDYPIEIKKVIKAQFTS